MNKFDRSKTLEELDGEDWGEPPFNSHLVVTTYALRKKPLKDFTVEDLRIKIGQNDSLEYLMPLALDVLIENPFGAGDFYAGDLLKAVLTVDAKFWNDNQDLWWQIQEIVHNAEITIQHFQEDIVPSIEAFRQHKPKRNAV